MPFTAKRGGVDVDYNPSEPLDETGERGVNINGQRYEVKVKGQAYSQAEVVSAFRNILDVDVPKETEWLETKIPRDRNGKITDPRHLKLGVIWINPTVHSSSKPFIQMKVKNSVNNSTSSANPDTYTTPNLDP